MCRGARAGLSLLLLGCGRPVAPTPADVDDSGITDAVPATDTAIEVPELSERDALILHVLGFYAAQRCGDADNPLFAGHPSGPSCHLQDGGAVGADLTGGWHDAGDHIKVTSTIAWTVYVMAMAMERRPHLVPWIAPEVAVGADYLARVRLDDDRLVHLVGGPEDHAVFVTAPFQSTLAPELGGGVRAVHTDGRADVAFLAAAALARLARVAEEPSSSYWMAEAEALWEFGESHPGTTSNPFYEDDDERDQRWCAAVELTVSAGPGLWSAALEDVPGTHWWAPAWWDPTDPCRATAADHGLPFDRIAWKQTVWDLIDQVSEAPEVEGLVWLQDWGSLPPAAAAGMSAALYAERSGDPDGAALAASQLAWILGDNPYQRSFVVGWGANPPTHPHHASAYGYDELEVDWTHEPRFQVPGALVGGPTVEAHGGGYEDRVKDYVRNEVTLDYDAALLGLLVTAP